MRSIQRLAISLSLFILLVSLFWIVYNREGGPVFYRVLLKEPPTRLPNLKLLDGKGKQVVLKVAGPKPLILNFWASWCEPCRIEMPSLNQFAKDYTKRGYRVVAAAVNDSFIEVEKFFGNTKPFFEVLWDRGGEVAASLGTVKYPETYVISTDGRELARFIGDVDWSSDRVRAYIETILNNN